MQSLFIGRVGGGPPHFKLGSIPVRVEISFLVIGVIFGLQFQSPVKIGLWLGCMFVSVLFHELGHALTYRFLGARSEIILHGGGGLTRGFRERPFSTGEQVFTSLAGPGFGLILGALAFAVHAWHGPFEPEWVDFSISLAAAINIFWSLFNLLPIVPMDGGHVLESLLCVKDPVKGRLWVRWWTLGLCVVLAPITYLQVDPWVSMLLIIFGLQAWQTMALLDPKRQRRVAANAAPSPERSDIFEDLERMHRLLAEDRHQEAQAVAFQVLSRAQSPGPRDAALRTLSWIAIGEGEAQKALGFLSKTSKQFDDPLVWGTAIAASGNAEGALPHLAQAHQRAPTPQSTAAYGRCLLAVGRRDEAMRLAPAGSPSELQRALEEALFRSRDYAGAAEVSKRLFQTTGEAVDAYNAACAEARGFQPTEALAWLQRAADAGFSDGAHLATDADLATLRGQPEFEALLQKLLSGTADAGA